MGYYVGQARFKGNKKLAWKGLLIAILLHALYDFPLLSMSALSTKTNASIILLLGCLCFFFIVFISENVWTLLIVRRLHKEQLLE